MSGEIIRQITQKSRDNDFFQRDKIAQTVYKTSNQQASRRHPQCQQ